MLSTEIRTGISRGISIESEDFLNIELNPNLSVIFFWESTAHFVGALWSSKDSQWNVPEFMRNVVPNLFICPCNLHIDLTNNLKIGSFFEIHKILGSKMKSTEKRETSDAPELHPRRGEEPNSKDDRG